MLFLYWIFYGIAIWSLFAIFSVTGFYLLDRHHRLDQMIIFIKTIKSLMWIIPLSWIMYGIYLLGL